MNNNKYSMIVSASLNRENPDASILLIGHKLFGENDLRCIKYVSGKEAIALYDLIFEAGEVVPNGKEAFDNINTFELTGNAAAGDVLKGQTFYTTDPHSIRRWW